MSSDLTTQYQTALAYVNAGADPSMKKPSLSQQLAFYAFFKQASQGKNTTPAPSRLSVTNRAKWDAWNKLGGMSKEDAMKGYVAAITAIDPRWAEKAAAKKIKSKL